MAGSPSTSHRQSDPICFANESFQSLAGSPSTSHTKAARQTGCEHGSFQSLAGSPSTSHKRNWQAGRSDHHRFNPWREAPPRATGVTSTQVSTDQKVSIPGGKPLHEPRCLQGIQSDLVVFVSIPGGKPLHEPLALLPVLVGAIHGFNPWREAPPRATLIEAAVSREKG